MDCENDHESILDFYFARLNVYQYVIKLIRVSISGLGCKFFEATDVYSALYMYVYCECEDGDIAVGVSYLSETDIRVGFILEGRRLDFFWIINGYLE